MSVIFFFHRVENQKNNLWSGNALRQTKATQSRTNLQIVVGFSICSYFPLLCCSILPYKSYLLLYASSVALPSPHSIQCSVIENPSGCFFSSIFTTHQFCFSFLSFFLEIHFYVFIPIYYYSFELTCKNWRNPRIFLCLKFVRTEQRHMGGRRDRERDTLSGLCCLSCCEVQSHEIRETRCLMYALRVFHLFPKMCFVSFRTKIFAFLWREGSMHTATTTTTTKIGQYAWLFIRVKKI